MATVGATAVILCGGLGTRLRPVIGTLPKVLAPIAGRPFIDYQIRYLKAQRVSDIVLCTGYQAELVTKHCEEVAEHGLRLQYSREHQPLGTGGAVRQALDLVRSNPFVVLNGDSFLAADLSALLDFHVAQNANITLALVEVSNRASYGAVTLTDDGAISAFGEKGRSGSGLINAGIYVLDKAVLAEMPTEKPWSLEHHLFTPNIGKKMYGMVIQSAFLDIGTPDDYARTENFLADWHRRVEEYVA